MCIELEAHREQSFLDLHLSDADAMCGWHGKSTIKQMFNANLCCY